MRVDLESVARGGEAIVLEENAALSPRLSPQKKRRGRRRSAQPPGAQPTLAAMSSARRSRTSRVSWQGVWRRWRVVSSKAKRSIRRLPCRKRRTS